MKKLFIFLSLSILSVLCFSQTEKQNFNLDSVQVISRVEFSTYSGQYGTENLSNKPTIEFIITVKNDGTQPIPDLAVSNRSLYLNFYINGKLENPMSLYNGLETIGNHMLGKGQSDSYKWWIFTEDAYADVFTVQWQYCGKLSEVRKVDMNNQSMH